jgi:hypothetical protein
MIVNAIRCAASNMHATMRRFDCTACCCLSLMQLIDACAGQRCSASMSHPQLVRGVGESPGELVRNARGGCHGRGRGIVRSVAFVAIVRCLIRTVGGSRRKAVVATPMHAPDARRHARSAVETMSRARPRTRITCGLTCYSPLSMSRSSRNGSALGGAEVSCRIAL